MPLTSKDTFISALEATDCPICFEVIKAPLRTDCGHVFCLDCAKTWFTSSNSCPTCKRELYAKPQNLNIGTNPPAANATAAHIPAVPFATSQHIQVMLQPEIDDDFFIKMRRTTTFEKVMRVASERLKLPQDTLRLEFDGRQIPLLRTAQELGIEDGDVIRVIELF